MNSEYQTPPPSTPSTKRAEVQLPTAGGAFTSLNSQKPGLQISSVFRCHLLIIYEKFVTKLIKRAEVLV